jgi:hypothetical protein
MDNQGVFNAMPITNLAALHYAAGILCDLIHDNVVFDCSATEPPRVGSILVSVGSTKIELSYSVDELRYFESVALNGVRYSEFALPDVFDGDAFSWMRSQGYPVTEHLIEWAIFWRNSCQ